MDAKRSSVAGRLPALLLAWYDAHRRDLPWRSPPGERPDPYRVWLSEVMLQQTTVATVRPRYAAWLARWPSVEALAAADEAEVMAAWAGLGYYARARNLLAAARAAAAAGGFPTTEAGLRALPGLGDYTAAAVAAIAFGRPAVVIDTNVARVVARLFALPDSRGVRARAAAIWPETRGGDFAQALMDLGATICIPRNPRCLLCPLRDDCAGVASGTPEAFPARQAKAEKPLRHGTVFWLERPLLPSHLREGSGEGFSARTTVAFAGPSVPPPAPPASGRGVEVLLVRRPPRGLLGGMRALPTGPWADAPPGLDGAPAPVDWRILDASVAHAFTHFRLELALAVASGGAQEAGEWWPIDRLADAGLPTVFRKAADAIGRMR